MVCCAIAETDSIKVHTTTNSFFIDGIIMIMILISNDKDTIFFVNFSLTALKLSLLFHHLRTTNR